MDRAFEIVRASQAYSIKDILSALNYDAEVLACPYRFFECLSPQELAPDRYRVSECNLADKPQVTGSREDQAPQSLVYRSDSSERINQCDG